MKDIKNLIRTANKIREASMQLQNERWLELLSCLSTFASKLKEVSLDSRKLSTSLTRNWFAAARRCGTRISRSFDDMTYSLQRAKQFLDRPYKKVPKLSSLVEELHQLQQEFGSVEFDNPENRISAVTNRIDLEETYLGPFEIRLHIDKLRNLYKDSPYYCIALDPHPAATSDDVTHPHVTNEKLCEGEGSAAIRAALEEGRLCDFFTMVRSILNTYNPDSAYISLNDWEGEPCYECGYVMNSENSYYCHFCDRIFCEECSTCCGSCDEIVCLGCAAKCEICEEQVCPRCTRTRCIECNSVCCESCIDDGLCPNCKEERIRDEEQEDREQNQSQAAGPEIKLAS